MATNRAFDPDNDNNNAQKPATNNATTDRQQPNENVFYDVHLEQNIDSSVDKISIADEVSEIANLKNLIFKLTIIA